MQCSVKSANQMSINFVIIGIISMESVLKNGYESMESVLYAVKRSKKCLKVKKFLEVLLNQISIASSTA